MIVVDKNNLINGNTVLAPQEQPERRREDKEKYDKLNEAKREALRKAREKQNRENALRWMYALRTQGWKEYWKMQKTRSHSRGMARRFQ